jgi:peroxiredoxin
MGTPSQTAELCRRRQVSFPCLSDPKLAAYKAYGLKRGSAGQVMGPAVMAKAFAATLRGNWGVQVGQDVFQMPGTFVIDRTGIIRYCHRNRDASDHPSIDSILSAVH